MVKKEENDVAGGIKRNNSYKSKGRMSKRGIAFSWEESIAG